MTWSISDILSQTCWKSTKNHTKTLAFTTLDILQLKKFDDYEIIYCENPLYLLVNHESGYIEGQMKTKSYWKNTQMFGGELKTKSKQ